jgi:hypothetical protein
LLCVAHLHIRAYLALHVALPLTPRRPLDDVVPLRRGVTPPALDQAGRGNARPVRRAVVETSSGLDMWLSATPVGSNGFCQVIDVVTAWVRHGVHVGPLIRRWIGALSALESVLQQLLYRLRASLGQRVDPCLCHRPVALDLGKIVPP